MATKIRDWLIIMVITALAIFGLFVLANAAEECQANGGMFIPTKVPVCYGGHR